MIGQSNMAGRGNFGDVAPIENELCFMLRNGRWQKMSEPVNPDRSIFAADFHSGVGPAASFADEYAKCYQLPVGLIPCADGGTSLEEWMPGELLYDHAVAMAKLAMRTSELTGILWHQGENDCKSEETVDNYAKRFREMITELRRELNAETVPVIVGELSLGMDCERWGLLPHLPERMNETFRNIAVEVPLCSVVSAKGLKIMDDGIHFDARSQREFGKRYFRGWQELQSLPLYQKEQNI